jgi:predicted nucleic acid-binding Zn ribbon protein
MDTLLKYKEKPLYEVPEDFFEQFQHDVMQRVTKEAKQHKIRKQWFSAISIAASITLIMALSYFIFLNRNTDEHFYVHEELPTFEDSVISLSPNHFAEATEIIDNFSDEVIVNQPQTQNPVIKNDPPAETIVYRAVDFYVDDFETETFYNTVYELDCYYDY